MSKPCQCAECGLPYAEMGLDLVLPDQQWYLIAPEECILCANCICKRARRFGGTVVLAWIDQVDYGLAETSVDGDELYEFRPAESAVDVTEIPNAANR